MRRFLLSPLLTVMLLALAADVGGQWTAQVPGRDGNTIDTTFTFKVSGDKLTGSMENQFGQREISDGKIAGDAISFSVRIDMGGDEIVLLFNGKVAGNEIRFTRERKGGGDSPIASKVEFVAKKK